MQNDNDLPKNPLILRLSAASRLELSQSYGLPDWGQPENSIATAPLFFLKQP